jgi:hypothetical protein
MLFGTAIEFTLVRARSPLLFPASAISIDQTPGSAHIGANVPAQSSFNFYKTPCLNGWSY